MQPPLAYSRRLQCNRRVHVCVHARVHVHVLARVHVAHVRVHHVCVHRISGAHRLLLDARGM